MVNVLAIFLAIFSVFSQSIIYYVTSTGVDNASCGAQGSPCSTINQVLTNYPGVSCAISIGSGNYMLTPITLQKDAFIIFQGTGNPAITAGWKSDNCISNTKNSGFEFHDLFLTMSGSGSSFTTLNTAANAAGFYNVVLACSEYVGDFVDILGGVVVVSNVTLNGASTDGYFILGLSDGENTNITVVGSNFSNVNINEDGGFLAFDAFGLANILVNSTTFTNISTDYVFIGIWSEDTNQQVSIANSVFSSTYTYLPAVYIENDYQCVISITSTVFSDVTTEFVSGAVETLGADDGTDYPVFFDNLTFANCSGPYAGALLVGYNSFNLSNSRFYTNHGSTANDIVGESNCNLTNDCSTSDEPRVSLGNKYVDLPNCTSTADSQPLSKSTRSWPPPIPRPSGVIHSFSRSQISAQPKFGRRGKKNRTS